jgi:hypothetical protein
LDGTRITTANLDAGRPVVVAFLCRHSPYVRQIESALASLLDEFAPTTSVIGIASNDTRAYPDDAPEYLDKQAREAGFTFPYCLDVDQRAARAFRASCTPEFFVYDRQWRLNYHGGFDSSRPGSDLPVTGDDLRYALASVRDGARLTQSPVPAFGCSIKWTAGHEPPYSYTSTGLDARLAGA